MSRRGRGVVAGPFASYVAGVRELLLKRGYTPFSVHNRICWLAWLSGYTAVASLFLVSQFGNRAPRWEALRAEHLTEFVIAKARRYRPRSVAGWVTALRSLVRYLHVSGIIPADLTGAIPGIHHPRL